MMQESTAELTNTGIYLRQPPDVYMNEIPNRRDLIYEAHQSGISIFLVLCDSMWWHGAKNVIVCVQA